MIGRNLFVCGVERFFFWSEDWILGGGSLVGRIFGSGFKFNIGLSG